MNYFYSPMNNAAYPESLKTEYQAAQTWPDDAVQITDETYQTFFACASPAGKTRIAGKQGQPVWGDIPVYVPTEDELAAHARRYRDAFIQATDPMMVSDYSIDDAPLTESQRSELITARLAFKQWPTLAGWPLIELPVISQPDKSRWLLTEAVNNGYVVPVWPPEPNHAGGQTGT